MRFCQQCSLAQFLCYGILYQNKVMASDRYANTLPFSGVKDAHDAIVVAVHTFFIEAGYKCIGIGEEIPESVGECATEALPQGWNDSRDVYTLQYKQASSFERKYLLKALRIGTRLAIHVLDVEKESSVDMTVDTSEYVTVSNVELLQHLYDYPRVVKSLSKLEQLFKTDIINKIKRSDEPSVSTSTTRREEPRSSFIPRPSPRGDDPLRVPPRHPNNPRPWNPPALDPFGFGDGDRLPGHPGSGGMLLDPFHQQHRGPESDFGHPGRLPRGAVPPGARFDPFGPVSPDGGMGGNPRSGRFSGPGPDHLRPPGFDDDMFM